MLASSRSLSHRRSGTDRGSYYLALGLVAMAFAIVGGARDDLVSLLVWRPMSVFSLALIVALRGGVAWREARGLLVFTMATALFVALQLVPLPPALWAALPGRDILVQTYRAADMDLPWQPLSMAQARTWNALFSLAGPAAVLIATASLDPQRHRHLLTLFLCLGFASGILGMLQAIGPANGSLYFYRITNSDSSVGLFANRNHQALFLVTMFPLLAARYSLYRGAPNRLLFYRTTMIAAAALLVPLILMTGSRGGMLLGAVAIAFAWWVYQAPMTVGRVDTVRKERSTRIMGWTIAVILVLALVVIAVRTPALQRLLQTDSASELRVQALPTVLHAIGHFMPWGSGMGTFVEVYQIFEQDRLISASYFNHAHNDFAETVLTGGIPAVALLIWWLTMLARWGLVLAKSPRSVAKEGGLLSTQLGRSGFSVLALFALGSAVDYPMRTPSLMIYAVVMAVWCANASKTARM